MQCIACDVDDETVLHTLWAVADRRSKQSQLTPGDRKKMLGETGCAAAMSGKWYFGDRQKG